MKRSGHVALFMMGTAAVGGGAYALMPAEDCDPSRAVIVAPNQTNTGCAPRQSLSSSGSGYRSSWSGSGTSSSGQNFVGGQPTGGGTGVGDTAGHVTRGGFGSIAHSFASHFSGGG